MSTRTLTELPPHLRTRIAGWLLLAERGWHLFPIRPGDKRPAIRNWQHRATTSPDRLLGFYLTHPGHNAGIACGPSGLYVIDADTPKPGQPGPAGGVAVLHALAAGHGGLPDGWTVATPSGGRHRYYLAPESPALGNTARALGPMLDTRGAGGYVLAPGSWLAPTPARPGRPGGPAGGYELIDDTDPPPLPTWIHQALTTKPATAHTAPPTMPYTGPARWAARYLARVVDQELDRIRYAGRGQHNSAVFTAARALGQLAAAGALDPAQVEQLLTTAAAAIAAGPCDCTSRDLAATIRSGLAHGTRRPRRAPHVEHTNRKASA